jgi:hypothetical protein
MHRFVHQHTTFDFGFEPHTVNRSCTDVLCCAFFLPFLAAFGYVAWWGSQNGDLRRLHGFPNSEGHLCGVSQDVVNLPLLYFCQDAHGHISHSMSVCVAECPNVQVGERRLEGNPLEDLIESATNWWYGAQNAASAVTANVTSALTSKSTNEKCPHGHLPDNPSCCLYGARAFGGMFCVPKDHEEMKALVEAWESPAVEWVLDLSEVVRAWEPLAISAGLAVVFGFVYLALIQCSAHCIVWGLVFLMVVVLAGGGFYLIASPLGYVENVNMIETSGDDTADEIIGAVMICICFFVLCVACSLCNVVNEALEHIEEACECLRERWSLVVEPLLASTVRTILIGGLGYGGLLLASCLSQVGAAPVAGASIEFVEGLEAKETIFLVFYLCFGWYIVEIYDCISYFAIAYITQQWWFRAADKHSGGACSLCSAICSCLTYHLGTMAFGALAIMVFRLPRQLVSTQVTELSDGQVVTRACSCACECCISCFEGFLRYMHRSAFMDVAINSNNFCKAAWFSEELLREVADGVHGLRVVSHLFQFLGVGGIAAAGALCTHLLAVYWSDFSDVDSDRYIENPMVLDAVSAVICGLLAWPFVHLLNPVATTILFCHSIDDYRRELEREDSLELQNQRSQRSLFFCCAAGEPPKAGRALPHEGASRKGFSRLPTSGRHY